MMTVRALGAAVAILGLATTAFGQCVDQCVLTAPYGNQNGIRMHRGAGVTATDFPNIATGNVAGDALWKVYPCSILSNAAGSMTLRGFEVPLTAGNWMTGVATNIPDVEIRPTVVGAGGCLEPDFAAVPIGAFVLGNITLTSAGAFRINVTLGAPLAVPNGDVAIVYLATVGETSATVSHARGYRTTLEVNPTPCGFSGIRDGALLATTRFAPTDEIRFELAFQEAALQSFSTEPGGATRNTGIAGYFPQAGTMIGWRCESFDAWNKGQLGLLVLSVTGGVCPGACTLPDPFGGPACASLTFDVMTTIGLGLPGVFGPFLLTDTTAACNAAGFAPFADGTRDTAAYAVAPGLTGFTLYAAMATLCLTPAPGTSPITEISNTVRMDFQ